MTRLILELCAVALLAGCSVPIVGVTGIGFDGAGRPVGYLAVCDEHINGAILDYDNPDQSSRDEPSLDAGSWTAVAPVTSDAAWTLAGADAGWRVEKPLEALDPGRQYTLYGWTRDISNSTGDVTFALADLEKLEPGQVRYLVGYDKEAEEDLYEVGSPEDFRAHSCSD